MRSPISARRTVIPSVLKVPPETEDLKENTLTRVESLLTTILAFCSPMKAINSPIPTELHVSGSLGSH